MSDPQPDEARVLTPVQNFWQGGYKDFRPNVLPADAVSEDEVKEVEETITPAPKDESAPESVPSSDSPEQTEPPRSESPVLPVSSPTTEETTEGAESESGKGSASSVAEFPLPTTTSPSPETSSPDSSSETPKKSGSPVPPAPALPPAPSAPTPKP